MASIHNGPETTFNLVIQDLDAGGSPTAEENPTVAEPAAEIEVQQKDPAARRRRKTHAELAPIDEAIKSLFEPGQLVELRIPKAGKRGVVSGYFKDYEKLATQIAKHSGKAGIEGIYYTMNPVDPRLYARAGDKSQSFAKLTTTDRDVICRRWLLIDIDPVRPAGISSSNPEKDLAQQKAELVHQHLIEAGWPEPVFADSGNGYHLLYAIDLPNDDANTEVIRLCLESLATKFDDSSVKIDTSVFNASRIVKAYGSLAAKGDSTADRPHRLTKVLRASAKQTVPYEKLLELAGELPRHTLDNIAQGRQSEHETRQITPEQVEQFLAFYDIEHKPRASYRDGLKWMLQTCVFNPEHRGTEVAVLLRHDGPLCYQCLHVSCQQKHWKDFRTELEHRTGKLFRFFDGQNRDDHTDVYRDATPHLESEQDTVPAESALKPLGPDAFYGLLGEFVERQLPETEADPPGLLFQALAMVGSYLGPGVYYRVRATLHRANLYLSLVGPTGCAKGEGKDCTDALIESTGIKWEGLTGLNSGEGIAAIAKDQTHPEVIKTICFEEPEFARLLEACYRKGSTIGPALRSAWDKLDFRVINSTSPLQAKAMVSMVTHITLDELRATLTHTDLSNGFANRILWVQVQLSKCKPDGGNRMNWADLGERLKAAKQVARDLGEIDFDPEAGALWHSVYPDLRRRPDNVFGRVTARAAAQVKRMAMIFALLPPFLRSESPTISLKPLQAALECWRYAEQSARQIFMPVQGTEGGTSEVMKVRIAFNRNGGRLTGTELYRLFSHKTAEERASIATRAGLRCRKEKGPQGKPVDIWEKW